MQLAHDSWLGAINAACKLIVGVRRLAEVRWNVLIVIVVDNVVLVLANDIHGGEHIERVVHSALHVLEIDFLTNLSDER